MSSAEHGMHLYGHSRKGDSSQQERVLLDEGRGLYEGGRYRDALERFEAAIALGPERENTHLWRGRALFRLEVFEEAAQAYLNALRKASRPSSWVYREVASVFLAIAGERYRRARYAETLEACEQAIGYSSQGDGRWENEGEAWRYRGHALFYLKRQTEALKAYAEAVERGSVDQQLHCNMGEIFTADRQTAAALNAYQEALVVDSSSLPALKGKAQALFLLGAYVESLKAYQLVQPFEENDPTVPLSIGDLHLLLGHQVEAHQAYEAALHAVGEDIALLSRLITVAWQDYRPFAIIFELLYRFIVRMPSGAAQNAAFDRLGGVYGAYCTGAPLPLETLKEARDKLYGLLQHFSVKRWPDILSLMAQGDERRLAQLLILLAPLSPAGLTELAHRVTLHWEPSLPDDDLGIRLYHVLETYGVPFDDADWLFAGELMTRGLYIQVKSILVDLVRQRPSPDRLWFLARAMEGRGDPAREQIEVLRRFLASTGPADSRCGEAWKRIAEKTLAIGEDGMAAVEALKQAERYGVATPVLRAFRAGDWEAIPALRHHPDHAFPAVVVIDLENDYEPDAEPGSRVFEIGAVRVKGGTELDACHLVIRRDFPSRKVAQRQAEVVDPQEAIRLLREFTGTAILAGHNIQAFDALHLRGMGMALGDDQLVDTLIFARLLFPDSIHHSLGLLCQALHVPCEGEAHTALPDARACAGLLHALGEELVQRGERLIAGFRALGPPGSAFDRAVLQPRRIPASSGCVWELDPAPIPPHVLYQLRDTPASPALLKAMRAETDRLIERFDPDAAFVQHLPAAQKTLVAAGGRARLERMLARLGERADIYVVPNPQTPLCPHRLRKRIEQVGDPWVQLSLFCLYQASHNRDAGTLYPLRLPPQDASLEQLGQMLLRACCACEPEHAVTCDALCEANRAMEQSRVLLATHENLLQQRGVPRADCLIIDDAEKLQMHFAEYAAERITSEPVRARSVEAFQLLHTRIISLLEPYMEGRTGLRARLSLQLVLSLMRSRGDSEKTLLAALRAIGPVGEELA